jgi:hypothetical protein
MTKSKSATAAAVDPPEAQVKKTTKLEAVLQLLRRPEGARIQDMMQATGWQPHSVRGALAGAIKKKLGLTVTSEKSEAGRIYRIVETETK